MLERQRHWIGFILAGIGVLYFTSILLANGVVRDASRYNLKEAAAVYAWQQNAAADWQAPTSWTPERTNPVFSDILVFNGGGTTTATNVPSEIIGQMIVSGDTTVNLESGVDVTLTVSGDGGDRLTIDPGSALNFTGAHAIATRLTTGIFAHIKGSMTFMSSGPVNHRLTAADPGAIRFETGSVFRAMEGFSGNPFGTTDLRSVVFNEGSTYICFGGGDPFGAAEPASVVVFESGSLFSLRADVPESFFSGRTYANFELDYPGRDAWTDADSALVMDDLTVISGTLYFYAHGSPGHAIKGNIRVEPGARLNFQDYFPGHTINLNGKSRQTVTGLCCGINPGNTMVIDNPLGLAVDNVFYAWNLYLINGVITVSNPSGRVRVPGNITRVNGYIDGYLSRDLDLNGMYIFDVGTKNGYSPVTVQVTAVNGDPPIGMLVRAVQSSQPNTLDPSKALSRHWQTIGSSNIISADLTFHYLDPTDVPPTANESNFVIQRFLGGFTQPPGVIDTEANTFMLAGLGDLNAVTDWTLAEPGAVGTPTPTSTPTNTPTATPTATPTPSPTATPTPVARALFDFDGDHRTDISVFRPATGAWYVAGSTAGFFGLNFGIETDTIAPADYDGDGKTDIAVYRPSTGVWYISNSSNGTVVYSVFGIAEDLPTPADYDGDGKADISVFRPSSGTWYRINSGDGSFTAAQFGADGDKPTIGDFDGDGKADIAVFRPSTGAWYQTWSSNGFLFGEQFGISTDKITHADYDGDGKTDIAIYRPSEGLWYIKNSATTTYTPYVFGLAEDIPTPGDFDGDGKSDIAVFRPADGTWYIVNSSTGGFTISQFGQNGDRPTQSAFADS